MAQRFSNAVSLQVKPYKLLPREIGAAAGYEAIRCWEHHKSIYVQPLSEDRDREREALIGLATAEGMSFFSPAHQPLRSPQLRDFGCIRAVPSTGTAAWRLLKSQPQPQTASSTRHVL